MGTFIDFGEDFDSVQEQELAPKGLYDLVVKDVQEPKEGKTAYTMLIEITKAPQGVNVENLKTVFHYLSTPQAEDDETKRKNKMRYVKRCAYLFGVELKGSSLNPMDFIGKKAKGAALDVKEDKDHRKSNILVLPEVPNKKK